MTFILAAIGGMITTLLQSAITYFIGESLTKSAQFRQFWGLQRQEENTRNFHEISVLVENIGWILKILAIAYAISAIITSISIIANSRF
jgi:membrane protein YqaA with SNARE-associated domain